MRMLNLATRISLLLFCTFVVAGNACADECTSPPCCNFEEDGCSLSCEEQHTVQYARVAWEISTDGCGDPTPTITIYVRCEGESSWTWVDQVGGGTQYGQYWDECPMCTNRNPDYIEYKLVLTCPGCNSASDQIILKVNEDCCD